MIVYFRLQSTVNLFFFMSNRGAAFGSVSI